VLVSTSSIVVEGELDASSTLGETTPGAGGAYSGCSQPTSPGTNQGGAGGSFGGQGGSGGGVDGAAGPVAALPETPTFVRGGCDGGLGSTINPVADAARGGGAVYLLAAETIAISGRINVSGAGARAGLGGGGGGGSGGLVGLDAASLSFSGQIIGNGGGGASGYVGTTSRPGEDPQSPDTPAAGGMTESTGSGGRGGYIDDTDGAAGDASTSPGHGGGGGGAVGWLLVPESFDMWVDGSVSPKPTRF
jgi:hypothetical protein